MDFSGTDAMVMPFDVIATRTTSWVVGGRWCHPLVSLSPSWCAATKGRRDSEFWSHVPILLRTTVSHERSWGVEVKGVDGGGK